jgi:hypothetical protein
MEQLHLILSISAGLGLAAAAGFRVFVPLLVVSIASRMGLPLSAEFAWLASTPALVALSVATVCEIGAYYVPFIDNALDALASPLAVVAGTILTAAVLTNADPLFKWSLAIIAGGGMAGLVQAKTVVTRGISSATTAGFANPIVSTVELGGAVTAAAVSVLMPLVALLMVFAILFWLLRGKGSRSATQNAPLEGTVV